MERDAVATFGDLLSRARRAAGLSQEELAEQAGLSARAISDLERGVNRVPRKDTLDMLATALDIPPDEWKQWERTRRNTDRLPARATETDRTTSSLPPRLTSFIGRWSELAELSEMLGENRQRLVTITGPGGIGKTSLAIQLAAAISASFRDGICYVSLVPVRNPDHVAATIATALGLQDRGSRDPYETLTEYLSKKHVLLVLDNFEHLIDATPLVADLLLACPGLKVLITSRTALHLDGEQEFPIAPLRTPPPGQHRLPERLTEHEAIDLFIERARLHRPDFRLTAENMDAVVEICWRLDGLPLAIELAATRVKLLPPQDLLMRLERRLPILTGGPRNAPVRQQTMRDTIAWSYDLLTSEQQRLFRQLSVFVGGWTLDAAENVCGETRSQDGKFATVVLDGLSNLIDQSLVQPVEQPDGLVRYTMLEMVREYGLDRLEEPGETGFMRGRHASYFFALAEAAAPHLDGSDPVPYLNQLEADHENLRAALAWLRDTGDIDRGLAMVGALREFWYSHGHLSEGHRQAELFLNHPQASAPTPVRARALTTSAWLALWQGSDDAIAHSEEALAIWRAVNDETQMPLLLIVLAIAVDHLHGDMERARSLNEQSLKIARSIGDARSIARALYNLSGYARRDGDRNQTMALIQESMSIAHATGDMPTYALPLSGLAMEARANNDLDLAEDLLKQVLRLHRNLGNTWGVIRTLDYVATIAVDRKQPERAIGLFAAAASLRDMTGITRSPNDRAWLENADSQLEAMFGEAAFAEAWAQARSMSPEEVIRDTIYTSLEPSDTQRSSTPKDAAQVPHSGLTKRELEVLRLLVDGHSNQEIATALFISPHTVATHVQNIMAKLGLESRTAVATYAVRHNLA